MLRMFYIFICFVASTNSSIAQPHEDLGVFTNTKISGDWLFSEIREMDGALLGCFMSTSPAKGDYSFENADLNILSLRQSGQKIRKMSILDVADPTYDPMFINGDWVKTGGWAIVRIGNPGDGGSQIVDAALFYEKLHSSGRFELSVELKDDAWELDFLAQKKVAQVELGDRRIVYSLRGSSDAISAWKVCDDRL